MFERYTEKARRIIFFARYEASQFGSPYIDSEHMLLGILREDKDVTGRLLPSRGAVEAIRAAVQGQLPRAEKLSTSVDLPLSNDCKRILAKAASESERLGHQHIGTEHLLLGILHDQSCMAAKLLNEHGVRLEDVIALASQQVGKPATPPPAPPTVQPVGIRFVEAGAVEPLLFYRQPMLDPIPRIGDTFALLTQEELLLQYRVTDVAWHYHPGPGALREIVVSVEAVKRG